MDNNPEQTQPRSRLITVKIDCKKSQNQPRKKINRQLLPEDRALLSAWRWKWLAFTGMTVALLVGTLIGRFLIP
jgi:hypothetical protein